MKNLVLFLFLITHHIALSDNPTECYGVFNEPIEGIQKSLSCNFQSTDWVNKYRLPETFIPNQNTPIKYINIRFIVRQLCDTNTVGCDPRNFDCSDPNHIQILQDVVDDMNDIMANNPAPSDPWTAVCGNCHIQDTRIRFVFKGMDCHVDNANHNTAMNVNQVLINEQNDLNILLMGDGPNNNGNWFVGGFTSSAPTILNLITNTYIRLDSTLNGHTYIAARNYHSDYFNTFSNGGIINNLLHELGHAMGLMHTYEPTCCKETCDVSNIDYLSDVFGLNPPTSCWEPYLYHTSDINANCDPFTTVGDFVQITS